MKNCLGCGQPRHAGLCKPTRYRVPLITIDVPDIQVVPVNTLVATQGEWKPQRGRPRKWAGETERKAAYRARKRAP